MRRVPRQVKLTITQEHIDSCRCPITLAVRQRLPSATFISVDLQTIRYSLPEYGRRFVWFTPSAGQAFLRYHDGRREKELRPFTMTLRRMA